MYLAQQRSQRGALHKVKVIINQALKRQKTDSPVGFSHASPPEHLRTPLHQRVVQDRPPAKTLVGARNGCRSALTAAPESTSTSTEHRNKRGGYNKLHRTQRLTLKRVYA